MAVEFFGVETPPHTWRKPSSNDRFGRISRNTSTYVEKTIPVLAKVCLSEKHLHIRGENTNRKTDFIGFIETPPHTWRKLGDTHKRIHHHRNTSTYVEKTLLLTFEFALTWKHLHIRGENFS